MNPSVGKVILVGAGPGDPGLLTLKAARAIESAEVILFDRLVGDDILANLPPEAEKIDVGKSSGMHTMHQREINRLLLQKALEGKTVVRLKGGDPYLFGRGAEELELLLQNGVPFEVIPGVTAAIAVPASAGIPVTHREFASSVHIITGHAKAGSAPDIPYESLVKLNGTLVFMMSVTALSSICEGLCAAGMDPATPAALVENGTRPDQRKLISTVGELPEKARLQKIKPPAVLVVGEVCGLSAEFDWFSRQPLCGVQVLITRPRSAGGELGRKLRGLGCGVTEYPCIRTVPLEIDSQLFQIVEQYQWIVLTSAVGVKIFFDGLWQNGVDIRSLIGIRFAAIGSETAREIGLRGVKVEYTPETYDSSALAAGLSKNVKPGERVLLFRAKQGARQLPEILRKNGLEVDDVPVYDTVYENGRSEQVRDKVLAGTFDFVAFTSASTVEGFVRSMGQLDFSKVRGLCIGEKTAAAARAYGIKTVVSRRATIGSMVESILEWRNNQ